MVEQFVSEHKPKKSLLRVSLKLIGYVVLMLLLLAGLLLGLLFIYQDEVKAIVIKELNKHLRAEVQVDPENIDLTVLKSFPYCSIEFNKVLMLETTKAKRRDTLLYSDRLNLYFNLRELWQGHYTIEKIALRSSVIKIRYNGRGEANFLFWESAAAEQGSDSLHFKLASIEAKNTRLLYDDQSSGLYLLMQVTKLSLKGDFSQNEYQIDTKLQARLHDLHYGQEALLKQKDVSLGLQLDVKGEHYDLMASELRINKVKLSLNGAFDYGEKLRRARIDLKAPDLDLEALLSLLPRQYSRQLEDYEGKGKANLTGEYRYEADKSYSLKSRFGIRNGSIRYKPGDMQAKQVQAEGQFELGPATSFLALQSVRLQLGGGFIEGQFQLRDFKDLQIQGKADVALENLFRFYPVDTLSLAKGQLAVDLDYNGTLDDLRRFSFKKEMDLELLAKAKDLEIQFKGDEKISRLPSCTLRLKGGEAELRDCRILRGKSDLLINGRAPGLFEYLRDRQNTLVLQGELFSENLYLEDLMVKYYSSGDKSAAIIPSNVHFKLDAGIRNFSYASFRASEISGNIEVRNRKAITSDLRMKVMEGEAEIEAFFDNSKDGLQVVVQSDFKHINISELFRQFGNFGQNTLMDQNLKGYASAQLQLSGKWSNALEADYNSIRSSCDLLIEKGELLGFEPLMQLSRFVDVKDLQHIRFSTLHSQVEIHDQRIFISKTEIRSNALNLEFWGSHSFNNEIDYHFQLLISELLAKKRRQKDNEFGEVLNDPENRRSAFILMTGTVDNPVIKFDKKGLKEKIRKDLKEEKQELKALLKEEFGLFRKDSISRKKPEAPKFELEKPGKTPVKKPLEPKKKSSEEEDDF